MQSKLPVRIKKKLEEKKCCCDKFFEIMIENPGDAYCAFCVRRGKSLENLTDLNIKLYSRSSQTETVLESEKKSLSDIKYILVNINSTLEAILDTLQDKKEFLYSKLQEECTPSKKNKLFGGKNKMDKFKKKNNQLVRKHSYGWPDISRIHYGQPTWLKSYMQKIAVGLAQHESSLVVCPRNHSWIYMTRPNSCPNINYFQPMRRLFERRKAIEICMTPSPIIAAIGQGDLRAERCRNVDSDENADDVDQFSIQDVDEREIHC